MSRGRSCSRCAPPPPRSPAQVTCGRWAGRPFPSVPAPSLQGGGAGKWEQELRRRRLARLPPPAGSGARGCMELPARLCALWALFLYAGGGDAAPAGECAPRTREGYRGAEGDAAERRPIGAAGPRAAKGMGTAVCYFDAQRSATAASGFCFEVGNPRAAGLSGSRVATAELEDEKTRRRSSLAPSGKAEEPKSLKVPSAWAWDPNTPAASGVAVPDPECRLEPAGIETEIRVSPVR